METLLGAVIVPVVCIVGAILYATQKIIETIKHEARVLNITLVALGADCKAAQEPARELAGTVAVEDYSYLRRIYRNVEAMAEESGVWIARRERLESDLDDETLP